MIKGSFDISNKTKGKLPRLPFVVMKNKILGEDYELSVVCVSKKESQRLNKQWRDKDYPTNILSFPLTESSGEIVLQLDIVKRDAPNFDMNYTNFLKFLVIHGCLHLKGFEHGSTMEKEEKKYLKIFL
ncbi:MAG: rRNA maturation RNase YbeY [Candidatus Nomurabacteria bacterium]|nr:rRNA maturation RNase YbeY [Candidatus Nomurabacteria bacterium]